MGKRIGFVLATIHQGSSIAMCKSMVETALESGENSLFVFPVGRLEYKEGNEYLRNQILSLVNKSNLDSVIVWSSSLTGKKDISFVEETIRKKREKGLPVVSLGLSFDGIFSVDFDAYKGMFDQVMHLIKEHGAKKIAFLRGPETHQSAETRYKAYKDALKMAGLHFDPSLVSPPGAWGGGKEAIDTLLKERSLVPKKDFDALVASSDLLLFHAVKELEATGFSPAGNIALAGFNNSIEITMMPIKTTTVKMPIEDMARTSYKIAAEIAYNSKKETAGSILLPASLIIRSSCGCKNSLFSNDGEKPLTKEEKLYALRSKVATFKEEEALCHLISEIENKNSDINKSLEAYFSSGGQVDLIPDIARLVFTSQESLGESDFYNVAMESYSKYVSEKAFSERMGSKRLGDFKTRLLAISQKNDLIDTLKECLPKFGINKAFIFLSEDDSTRLFGGFSGKNTYYDAPPFNSEDLVGEELEDEINEGLFAVEPLFYDNEYVGYMVLGLDFLDGSIVEDIRTSISASLKSLKLFLLSAEKSERAEREESKSLLLYSKLTEGLKNQFDQIYSLLDEAKFSSDEIKGSLVKAEHLVELISSDLGSESLEMRYTPCRVLQDGLTGFGFEVKGGPDLPSFMFDRKKLLHAFNILSSFISDAEDEPVFVFKLLPTGLEVSIEGKKRGWKPTLLEKTPSLLLCEKIILSHEASLKFSSFSIKVFFSFPSISGIKTLSSSFGSVLYISEGEDSPFDSYREISVVRKSESDMLRSFSIPKNISAVALKKEKDKSINRVLLNLIVSYSTSRNLPFMFFGLNKEYMSLSDALEEPLSMNEKKVIYYFDDILPSLSYLSDYAKLIKVESLSEITKKGESVAMIIINKKDIGFIKGLQNDRRYAQTPILLVSDRFTHEDFVFADIPNLIMVNSSVPESDEFVSRLLSVFAGGEMLMPLTASLVKKAIIYLNEKGMDQISRWQVAASVNISEDYLTRIFRKETGLSPWEYLNRFRIQEAQRMLKTTSLSINEISRISGFQDQAYFCRVFRKIKGFPPGQIRTRSNNEKN